MTYEKLAKIASSFGLRDSILHIWAYSLHIGYGLNLPMEYAHSRRGLPYQMRPYVHEFYLDLYLREVLQHAGASKGAHRSLRVWADLGTLHNAIRAYSDFKARCDLDIWTAMHRIGHQQLPHFDRFGPSYFGRYWSLYKRGKLSDVVYNSLGLSSEDYFLMAGATQALFTQNYEVALLSQLSALGLDHTAVQARVAAISGTPKLLRDRCILDGRYDSSWDYTPNPVVVKPLIQLRSTAPDRLACPRPSLLGKRLSAGLFYDLAGATGFAQAYGDAFEELVGDLFSRMTGATTAERPAPYSVGGSQHHGSDWLLRDASATVFVECKTMRIPVQAQLVASAGDLESGLKRLARAIVQNYRNILDATSSRAGIQLPEGPIYSLIVTLEDWVLFGQKAVDALTGLVGRELEERGMDASIPERYPFAVVGYASLPHVVDSISEHGLRVFTEKATQRFKGYLFPQFLTEASLRSEGAAASMFDSEWDDLMGRLRARFPTTSAT
jgi:hypothetical protein